MMMTETEKAVLEYARPIWITAGSVVNRARKRGMTAMLASVRISPWRADRTIPWVAAASARRRSPAPSAMEMTALIPTPKPMATALMKFWTG